MSSVIIQPAKFTFARINRAQNAVQQCSPKWQKGFTIIEALVAFLILSVGMLGVGSLQLISLKAGHTAAYRTVAVIKVEEMFERIRNNPTAILKYDDTSGVAIAAADKNCNDHAATPPCSIDDMVANDKYEWKQEIIDSLSANAGVTTAIAVAPPVVGTQPLAVVTLTVSWNERNTDTQTLVAMNYSTSADICTTTAC